MHAPREIGSLILDYYIGQIKVDIENFNKQLLYIVQNYDNMKDEHIVEGVIPVQCTKWVLDLAEGGCEYESEVVNRIGRGVYGGFLDHESARNLDEQELAQYLSDYRWVIPKKEYILLGKKLAMVYTSRLYILSLLNRKYFMKVYFMWDMWSQINMMDEIQYGYFHRCNTSLMPLFKAPKCGRMKMYCGKRNRLAEDRDTEPKYVSVEYMQLHGPIKKRRKMDLCLGIEHVNEHFKVKYKK